MKELKEFTVERLEYLASLPRKAVTIGGEELAALAKIALAAKQKSFIVNLGESTKEEIDALVERFQSVRSTEFIYAEQHMVVPDGWINCSERMPESCVEVVIRTSHGEVIAGETDRAGFLDLHDGTSVKMSGATHWMPLPPPAAPKPESE